MKLFNKLLHYTNTRPETNFMKKHSMNNIQYNIKSFELNSDFITLLLDYVRIGNICKLILLRILDITLNFINNKTIFFFNNSVPLKSLMNFSTFLSMNALSSITSLSTKKSSWWLYSIRETTLKLEIFTWWNKGSNSDNSPVPSVSTSQLVAAVIKDWTTWQSYRFFHQQRWYIIGE